MLSIGAFAGVVLNLLGEGKCHRAGKHPSVGRAAAAERQAGSERPAGELLWHQ